jgi:thioredoxin 1
VATVELDFNAFGEIVTSPGIVLVDLWAEWCGPCKQFGPIFEAASEANKDIIFGKVDTEAHQDLAGALEITSIPTLMVFRDGIMLYNRAGALPAPMLDELISAVRNVNMDEVRADIAAGPAGADNEEVTE